jgi:DNA replication protein DnaC
MTNPQLLRPGEHLQHLKLFQTQERLETLLQEASAQELTYADFLDRLLTEEVTAKEEKHLTMRTVMARFPYRKTLESFDFGLQPSVDRKKVQELAICRFIEHGDNVVFLGPPGTGKTHLAIVLGLKAVQQRYRPLFTSAMSLIAALTKAYAENRLEERFKHYSLPKLLIIDEIGDIPIDQHGAHLFFQLISRRYERGSIVLTSNQSFGQWGEVFGNPIIATAILDRLLHHSVVINIKGESYRLREKQKAGLLKKPEPSLVS